MKVLVLNGSPSGNDSVTLYTVKYIEKHFPQCAFEVMNVAQRARALEKDFSPCAEALRAADMILFCYPVYTFLAPAQLHRVVERMKELDLSGKWAAQISTSKHFYDVTAHRFIQDNCDDMGLRYLGGLSADMDDLLTETGRRQALEFFEHALWRIERGYSEPPRSLPGAKPGPTVPLAGGAPRMTGERKPGTVVVVTDRATAALDQMVERFCAALPYQTRVVDLSAFKFDGGCLGCFHCASDGQCVYRDGFDAYLRKHIQSADATVYAYAVKDHSMGYTFKLYDDRQFCNGHRTVTMGKPVGYLVDGDLDGEENLRLLMQARAQVGGNHLAGIATSARDPAAQIDQLAAELSYALENDYRQPQSFYGVGGMKIFRDLIYQMRGMMRADHRFYKAHGFYDFPQKRRGRILAIYAVGALMNSKRLRKKLGGRMTEGMVMPYKKVLEDDK